MGDLQASDPKFWYPKGTVFTSASSECWPDVMKKYGLQNAFTIP
jgi:hypothetical protein